MNNKIIFSREWAMPDRWTFKIEPIARLVHRYVGNGIGWIDPFAGENSPAEITNDINPERPTKFHLHALDFAKQLEYSYNGVLFDPPYSLTQVKECYNSMGIELMSKDDANYFPTNIKDAIAPKITLGGYAISFGWDSIGFGFNRGFQIVEIMLVSHGGRHNDTIVTVERKTQIQLF